VFRAGLAGVTI